MSDDPGSAAAEVRGPVGSDRTAGRLTFALVGLAAALPRLLTAGNFQTVDEPKWMRRSGLFEHALTHGHLSRLAITSGDTATMPGITTMWLGTVAKVVFEVGRRLHLVPDGRIFETSTQGVALAQATVAVATAALVGLVAWLVGRWASTRVGVAFGLLLATGPFWVAHGAVLHTDELTALLGLAGLVALAIGCGVPRPVRGVTDSVADPVPRRWGAAAGVLLAGSAITKLTGCTWALGALILVGWSLIVRWRRGSTRADRWSACRPLLVGVTVALAGAVVTVAVLYPALWLDPVGQWNRLVDSARLGGEARAVFHRGRMVDEAPMTFYAYVLPWRMTPWALAIAVVGIPVALFRSSSRSFAVVACALAVPPVVVLSLAAAKYDRYGLMILAPVLLAGCLALQPRRRDTATGRGRWARFERPAWGVVGLAGLWFSCSVAPWGLVYFDPVLGGGHRAQSTVAVGWYEQRSAAYEVITRDVHRLGRSCSSVTTAGTTPEMVSWSACGRWVTDPAAADYVVIGITKRQRLTPLGYGLLTYGRTLVDVVEVRGIRYAEVWRAPTAARPAR